jgi:hypothetical protein
MLAENSADQTLLDAKATIEGAAQLLSSRLPETLGFAVLAFTDDQVTLSSTIDKLAICDAMRQWMERTEEEAAGRRTRDGSTSDHAIKEAYKRFAFKNALSAISSLDVDDARDVLLGLLNRLNFAPSDVEVFTLDLPPWGEQPGEV